MPKTRRGGAVALSENTFEPTSWLKIYNSFFKGNLAKGDGGAIGMNT